MRLLLLALLFMAFATDAAAYLDPATGSIILQGLIAGVAAFIAFVRNPIQTIKAFLSRFRKTAPESMADDGSSND